MNRTSIVLLAAILAVLVIVVGLLFAITRLAAPPPAPSPQVPTADLASATPTRPPEVPSPQSGRGKDTGDVTPTHLLPISPVQQPPDDAPPAPAGGQGFQPISPIPGGEEAPQPETGRAVGEEAPDFTLEGAQGVPVTLSDHRGQSDVVLVFYRGQT